jgi:SAM-dependent methyltransferase
MGFYERVICNSAMDSVLDVPAIHAERALTLGPAQGRILEVGIGTGLNLQDYPARVETITAVSRDPELDERARARATARQLDVRFVMGDATKLPFADDQFDTVVCTFLLCSVNDAVATVRQFRRVLAPGGRLVFLEHVRSPHSGTRLVQRLLNPLSLVVSCGCSLIRDSATTITGNGFTLLDFIELDLPAMPLPYRRVVRGIAAARPDGPAS